MFLSFLSTCIQSFSAHCANVTTETATNHFRILLQLEHTFIELTPSHVKCNLLSYWTRTHICAARLADTSNMCIQHTASVVVVEHTRNTNTSASAHTHADAHMRACVCMYAAHTHLPHILYSGRRRSRSRKKRQENNIAYKTYCNMPFQAFHTY